VVSDDWWDEDGDINVDEISESKIQFSTSCGSGNHLYTSGNDLACETDATDDSVSSSELEGFGCSDSKILKRINGVWNCSDDQTGAGGVSDTNASSACSGTTTYLDGGGNCDDISSVYVNRTGDTMSGDLDIEGTNDLKFDGKRALVKGNKDELIINTEADFSFVDLRGKLKILGDIIPYVNKTYDLGNSTLWWGDAWIQTLHQGDLREYYLENPNYDYVVGDIVAMDLDSEYEIRPLMHTTDRLIGVVAGLPHDVVVEECDEEGCHEVTIHIDTDVAIYGKFSPVKVKGTVHIGDYLVASDEPGVVTSMYDREHPMFESSALKKPKSKDKDDYNQLAKMLPTLGIAMEEYDSDEVGTIKVVLGK